MLLLFNMTETARRTTSSSSQASSTSSSSAPQRPPSFFALTPYRGIFLHLLLIGIPYRFGLLPTGWFRGWLIPDNMLGDRCTIFFSGGGTAPDDGSSLPDEQQQLQQQWCSPFEEFVIRDFGVRFNLFYELAVVVWLTMRQTNASAVAFHKILLGASAATLVKLAWLQNYYRPPPHRFEFNPEFFVRAIFYHLLAICVSFWIVSSYPKSEPATMKWSIPGNAVFTGAVINLFVSVYSFQTLFFDKDGGIKTYYSEDGAITSVVRVCFALSAFYTAVHSVLLLRIRTFLNMRQLRAICLYKFVVNVVLPFFWLPDVDPYVNVDQRLTFSIRAVLISTYFFGFLWAGQAEGLSRILSGEKEL